LQQICERQASNTQKTSVKKTASRFSQKRRRALQKKHEVDPNNVLSKTLREQYSPEYNSTSGKQLFDRYALLQEWHRTILPVRNRGLRINPNDSINAGQKIPWSERPVEWLATVFRR
jgi:hypothetical protein